MSVVAGFYRTCVIDGVLEHSPAEYVRRHLQFEAMLAAARDSGNPNDFALVCLLGLLGLRIFETTGLDVNDLGEEHGHRVLRVLGKGNKLVLVPLPPSVARAVDRAIAERTSGPILLNREGRRMTRHSATRRLHRLAETAGLTLPRMHPRMLRHTFVTTMLDAGVDLRDTQIAARHAPPSGGPENRCRAERKPRGANDRHTRAQSGDERRLETRGRLDLVTLTELLKQYCDPVLRPVGLRRRGQLYELRSEQGDLTKLYAHRRPSVVEGEIAFNLGIEVWLDSHQAWRIWQADRSGSSYTPSSAVCFWWFGLRPPTSVARSPLSDIWTCRDEASVARCGAALKATLVDPGLPLLLMGQNRRSMLASWDTVLTQFGMLNEGPHRGRVLLLIDDGPSIELDAALAACVDDLEFLAWAQTRLSGDRAAEST